MMDRPAIHAVEEFVHAGYPLDVEALLIVELDGPRAEVDHLLERVQEIANACRAVTCRVSNPEEERLLFWAGRKAAFPRSAASRRIICAWTAPFRAAIAAGAATHEGDVGEIRTPRRQRVPCR